MNKFPFISIIIPTLNNEKDIKMFLDSIKRQIFPKNKIEIIISDGGSTDNTLKIAKKMGAKIIKNPYVLPDPGVNLGIKAAKGEILMVLACDNIYMDKNAFKKMVEVFDDKKIFAAFPMHSSSKEDSIYTKYINTFTDPFSHFIYGYAANGRTFKNVYKTLESNKIYDLYDYSSNKDKPLIAVAQGFTIRKGFIRSKKNDYDDVLPVIELINKKNNIAFVHSVKLYHHTVRNYRHFVRKQIWATVNALQKRRYGVMYRKNYLSDSERFKIRVWPFYALSFIIPLIRSIYYAIKDGEILWIIHSFLCMTSALSSVVAYLIFLRNKNYEFKR